MSASVGVLLVNLGTPEAPRTREVRRYLAEFLADPRVLDIPAPMRWLLLHGVILRTRPRSSARAYAQIWTDAGSPLLVHGRALRSALALHLGAGYRVALGMRYGRPTIADAIDDLLAADVSHLVVFPLFPQESEAAAGSARARVLEHLALRSAPAPHFVEPFFADPGFVDAWRTIASPVLEAFTPDHVLMSYHGLPERQIRSADREGVCLATTDCCRSLGPRNTDCYRAQCFATSYRIAAALGLASDAYSVTFQSRLGRTPWIEPHTDRYLPVLRERGVARLAVLCPAFVADCLETLEEIGIRAREQWTQLGGEALELVPCLNAHPRWVEAVAQLVAAPHTRERAAATPETSASAKLTPSR